MVSKMLIFGIRAEIDANLALVHTCESIMNAYESVQPVSAWMHDPVYVWAYRMWYDSKSSVSWLRHHMFEE